MGVSQGVDSRGDGAGASQIEGKGGYGVRDNETNCPDSVVRAKTFRCRKQGNRGGGVRENMLFTTITVIVLKYCSGGSVSQER